MKDKKEPAATLLDEIRTAAARLGELLAQAENDISEQHQHAKASGDIDEMQRLTDADPFRWLADAKHSMQAGVMFAERAINQPTNF